MSALPVSATEVDLLRVENAQQKAQIADLTAPVEKLTFQLALLTRLRFGQSSEALSAVMGDLFGQPTALEQKAEALTPPPSRKASREPKPAARVTLPPGLPVEVIEIDLPEANKRSASGQPLVRIGEETSDRLAMTPGRFFIRRTVRPKHADRTSRVATK
jgi:transposase